MQPLVTISVLSYQRRDALVRTLRSAVSQDYPALEVIVVDNASGAALTSFVKREFPQVRWIELGENIGTAARNEGIRAARGDIVVTLDNDVFFDDALQIQNLVGAFQRHPRAGCVVFNIRNPVTGQLHTRDWWHPRSPSKAAQEEFETCFIAEGASAFRGEVFEKVEPYWPALFITHEGLDLSLRVLDAGYEIWYVPAVRAWHIPEAETRHPWRPFYFSTRNLLLVVCRNYPWFRGLLYLAPRLAVLGFYSLKAGFPFRFLSGVADGLRLIPEARMSRKPLREATLRKLAELRRFERGPIDRFMRHWREVEF